MAMHYFMLFLKASCYFSLDLLLLYSFFFNPTKGQQHQFLFECFPSLRISRVYAVMTFERTSNFSVFYVTKHHVGLFVGCLIGRKEQGVMLHIPLNILRRP